MDQSEVELDSLELTFRDQYLGRSEMWRLKMNLVDTGVYLGKKIEFCSATIRCQVHEMWCAGHKVGSGVVSAATKVGIHTIHLSSSRSDFLIWTYERNTL